MKQEIRATKKALKQMKIDKLEPNDFLYQIAETPIYGGYWLLADDMYNINIFINEAEAINEEEENQELYTLAVYDDQTGETKYNEF